METINHIKLLFFATLRDQAGMKSVELDIPADMTLVQLKEKLVADYPNLRGHIKSVLITINREYSSDDAMIPSNAEIALFPPVSGG
ncbi:MAG: molybdopterin converting factor subunit 1 [Chloroflexi bacterium]|nr:molybdopterin converting factor subunit 1 [Chloroflexota bacterium]